MPRHHRVDRASTSAWLVRLPFGLVLLVAAVGVFRIVQYHWREGSALFGLALLLAAALRAALPPEKAGLLAVRGRAVDVFIYAGLAVLVIAIALTIVGGPFA